MNEHCLYALYIYFINLCLSASLLRPDGVKHNIHDTHAHINNTQHMDHKTQPPDDAPHASPRVESHAGPCATPFHTYPYIPHSFYESSSQNRLALLRSE